MWVRETPNTRHEGLGAGLAAGLHWIALSAAPQRR